MKSSVVLIRFSPWEVEALELLGVSHGCSRSEAARMALSYGIQFAKAGHTFNVTRAVLLLEYTQAAIDVIITRDHGACCPNCWRRPSSDCLPITRVERPAMTAG